MDEEFCAVVGEDYQEPTLPSAVTRRLWLRAADTYDVEALKPLWEYTAQQYRRYGEHPAATSILQTAAIGVAMVYRMQGRVPPADKMTYVANAFQRLPASVGWGEVQAAVEALAVKWESVGR